MSRELYANCRDVFTARLSHHENVYLVTYEHAWNCEIAACSRFKQLEATLLLFSAITYIRLLSVQYLTIESRLFYAVKYLPCQLHVLNIQSLSSTFILFPTFYLILLSCLYNPKPLHHQWAISASDPKERYRSKDNYTKAEYHFVKE